MFILNTQILYQRYQDNLEFMQWFKRFFEMQVQTIGDYDAVAQRAKGKGILHPFTSILSLIIRA